MEFEIFISPEAQIKFAIEHNVTIDESCNVFEQYVDFLVNEMPFVFDNDIEYIEFKLNEDESDYQVMLKYPSIDFAIDLNNYTDYFYVISLDDIN